MAKAIYMGAHVGSDDRWRAASSASPASRIGSVPRSTANEVERALATAAGRQIRLSLVVDHATTTHDDNVVQTASAPSSVTADEDVDTGDLVDAPPDAVISPDRSTGTGLSGFRDHRRAHLMAVYTQPVQALIDELGRLPGIGPKSAQRIAFHLLKLPTEDVTRLAMSISDAKARVRFCTRCWNFADGELCPICLDDRRDATTLCVVEESRDIVSIEKTGEFRGRYHVLLGAMSPLDGIGPEQLKMKELFARLEPEGVQEVIVCTNPNTEGEVTAMYLARMLRAVRDPGHPHRQRSAGRRRPRVRRRADARPGPRGPPRAHCLSCNAEPLTGKTGWGTTPGPGSGRTGQLQRRYPRS